MNNQQLSLAEKFWNEIQFEGKEFTRVEQNNILFSPGNHWPEKVLVEWNLHTNVDDFSPFITKYQVWKEECNQHLTALENQPNLKLLSRIEHLIQQGLEEKMIGDIHPLMSALEQGRQELNQLHQIRLIDIEQILQNLESINLQEDWSQETLNEAHELIEQWEIKTNYQHAQLAQYHTRWNNFRIKFNQRKAYFLEKRNIERMNNMDLKMQICEEAEDIMNSEDWKTTSSTMEELLDRWKQIGMAPTYEKNEELWERFRAARNHFFDRRKAFQELQKEEEEKNLALKLALVEESETLNGPPWKKNDERHQEIMKEWKTIGKIPYDQIETLWNRLQQSRDVFYEARRENAKAFRMELEKNYEIKKQLADQAEELKNSTDWRTATEQFNQLMDQWKNTGRLSKEHGDELWEQFIQARRHFFDRKDQHRQQIQEKQQERVAQRKAQLSQEIKDLEWVINDEKSKITEFKESLERIQDNSPKDVALKKHLNDLIAEIEQKLPKKEQLLHEPEIKVKHKFWKIILMTRKLFSILFIMLLIFMGSTFHLFAQKYHFINKNVADGLPQSQATIFSQDENGQLLIGTFGGLGIYDGYNIKKIDKSNGLLSNLITHIDRDSKGILYIIHVNGLTKIAQHQTFHYKFPKQDLFFNSMIIDQKDQIWILLNNQLFLFKNGDFINFMDILTEQNTLLSKSDNILSIGLNAKNELLIATAHQGILKWDGKSLTTFFKNNTQLIINQLFIDNNGLIYIIDLKNIYSIDRLYNLKKHTIPSLKSEEYITKFYIDSKKNYWLATNLGGIYYKADQDEWEYINFEKGFTSEQILDIYEDNEQTIWLSTDGSGIFSFKHQGVTYYDDYSGFNTLIISIIEDIHNNVLLVGNQGLYILYNQNNIRELLYKGKQIRGLDIIKVDNGSIYIATLLHGILKWDGQKLISILPYSIGYINSIYQHQSKLIFSSAHQLYEWHAENIQKLNFPFNSIATLALNNEHLLLSTLNGVFIYNLEKDNYQEYELIDNKNILSLTQNEQYIFLGSLEDGLYIVDKKSQKVRLITSEEGLSCNSVYSLMLDQYNQLWIGTGCGLDMIKFQEDPPFIIKKMADYLGLGHIETNSRGLYEDHEGKIWIGTNNKLFIYDPKKDQISHKIGRPPLLFESVQLFSKSIWASELNMEAITNTDLPLHPIFRPTENHLTFSYKAVSLSQANNINYRYQLIGVDKDFTETKQTTVIYPNLSPGEYNFRVWASDLEGHFDDHHFIDFPFTINTPYWQTMYFWIGLLLLSTAVTFGIMYYRNKWKQDRLIWAQQLREEAQDKVRQSTAEDFHDEIGNKLTRIKLLSSIAKIKVSKENQEAQKILEQIIDNVQQLFTGSKDIIWSLQPDSNYLNEVIWKIQQNAEQLVDNSNISLSMDDEKLNNPWKIQLPMQWGRNILMIFKEALTNAVRHSRAQEISFKVWEEDDSITLILKDNGQGISTNITEGNGLRNMQLRAQRIDASLNIKSNSKGTEIQLILWKEKLKRK